MPWNITDIRVSHISCTLVIATSLGNSSVLVSAACVQSWCHAPSEHRQDHISVLVIGSLVQTGTELEFSHWPLRALISRLAFNVQLRYDIIVDASARMDVQ